MSRSIRPRAVGSGTKFRTREQEMTSNLPSTADNVVDEDDDRCTGEMTLGCVGGVGGGNGRSKKSC